MEWGGFDVVWCGVVWWVGVMGWGVRCRLVEELAGGLVWWGGGVTVSLYHTRLIDEIASAQWPIAVEVSTAGTTFLRQQEKG